MCKKGRFGRLFVLPKKDIDIPAMTKYFLPFVLRVIREIVNWLLTTLNYTICPPSFDRVHRHTNEKRYQGHIFLMVYLS